MTNQANTKSRLSRRSFIKGAAGLGVLAAAGCFLPQTSFFRSAKNSAAAVVTTEKIRSMPCSHEHI